MYQVPRTTDANKMSNKYFFQRINTFVLKEETTDTQLLTKYMITVLKSLLYFYYFGYIFWKECIDFILKRQYL